MKVTKYPHSCLLLEKEDRRIVIDPGSFFTDKYSVNELGDIEAVLYTHQHGDHFDRSIVGHLKSAGAKIYCNIEVATLIGEDANPVQNGKKFSVAGFEVVPHDIAHFSKPGVEMPHNTGYMIDGCLFHPGDGTVNNGVVVKNLALPIAGPFDFSVPLAFINSAKAEKVIPIHYANQEMYPCNPGDFVNNASSTASIILLEDGQSVEL